MPSGIQKSSVMECGGEVFVCLVWVISQTSYCDMSSSSTSLPSTTIRWRWNASRHGWSTAFDATFHLTRPTINNCLSSHGRVIPLHSQSEEVSFLCHIYFLKYFAALAWSVVSLHMLSDECLVVNMCRVDCMSADYSIIKQSVVWHCYIAVANQKFVGNSSIDRGVGYI